MKKISVILADDHAILRYGLKAYLSKTEDIEVIGEATNGEQCLQLFKQKNPDICLIDIGMPRKNGIEVVQSIRRIRKQAKIIILSMHSDKETIDMALEAGIEGYLMKDTPKREIAEAIRQVQDGQTVIPASPAELNHLSGSDPCETAPESPLTTREMEILQLVVEGNSSPQIAHKLYISPRTVDTHRNNIMRKLDIKNTASLVRFALQHRLVQSS